MTHLEAKILAPIIQAFAEGKTVQVKRGAGCLTTAVGNEWEDAMAPTFFTDFEWRIKPEPAKPREWWAVIHNDPINHIWLPGCTGTLYVTEPEVDLLRFTKDSVKLIRVREVLD